MIPDKVNIGCYEYDVILTDDILIVDGKRCKGKISYDKHLIELMNTEVSMQSKEQTLWHEIVHGIIDYRNIDVVKCDEETLVEEISIGLYGLCKQNGILPGQCREVLQEG